MAMPFASAEPVLPVDALDDAVELPEPAVAFGFEVESPEPPEPDEAVGRAVESPELAVPLAPAAEPLPPESPLRPLLPELPEGAGVFDELAAPLGAAPPEGPEPCGAEVLLSA